MRWLINTSSHISNRFGINHFWLLLVCLQGIQTVLQILFYLLKVCLLMLFLSLSLIPDYIQSSAHIVELKVSSILRVSVLLIIISKVYTLVIQQVICSTICLPILTLLIISLIVNVFLTFIFILVRKIVNIILKIFIFFCLFSFIVEHLFCVNSSCHLYC